MKEEISLKLYTNIIKVDDNDNNVNINETIFSDNINENKPLFKY